MAHCGHIKLRDEHVELGRRPASVSSMPCSQCHYPSPGHLPTAPPARFRAGCARCKPTCRGRVHVFQFTLPQTCQVFSHEVCRRCNKYGQACDSEAASFTNDVHDPLNAMRIALTSTFLNIKLAVPITRMNIAEVMSCEGTTAARAPTWLIYCLTDKATVLASRRSTPESVFPTHFDYHTL
ncbi:hypothetical protein K461DRAFT_12509 [Myriangium duriaei CBS 260.36]|uniref:Uncharacterized protein n=1 Tax=Myriangium duriaei CBS 260.36 TaxID=1168546 RepID=A0A9P4MLD9_9PEZI|nr:hypothetical protein K461DRAFT_12509 [Myriangium duriaei CBS 260.36]